jgi:ATP synthase protein I
LTFVVQDSTDPTTPPPAEDPALVSLQHRLDAARQAEDERLAREHLPLRDQRRSVGMQVASTMVGYPLGGIVIGWGLDQLFGTHPWIMLGLMFMAFAGACLQVVRGNNNRQN